MMKYISALLLWHAMVIQFSYGQTRTDLPREKLFIHRDRGDYLLGDTLWYRGYVLRADGLVPGDSLDVAYVEIIDGAGEMVQRVSAPCHWGGFSGRIVLDEEEYGQGEYTLRGYKIGRAPV